MITRLRGFVSNNSMQHTALRTAADAGSSAA